MVSTVLGTPVVIVNAGAIPVTMISADTLDTSGNAVPTYKAHTYTYDGSGNTATDTVSDGSSAWTRSYSYQNGQLVSDSGWVKQ